MLSSKYNRIARLYHPLSYLVYGNRLLQIQEMLLSTLPKGEKMLVMGGGDGRVLPIIYQHDPHITLDYVEASSGMLRLAKKKCPTSMRVQFLLSDTLPDTRYDLIFLPFFLDQFTENELPGWQQQIAERLLPGGHVLLVDFYRARAWKQQIVLFLTIFFFRLTVDHRPKTLPKVFEGWSEYGFKTLITKTLSGTLLRASILTQK